MFRVTAAALNRLSSKLIGKKANDDEAFRFTEKKGGWALCLDCARPTDTTFSHDGREVLLMDAEVSRAMAGMKLGVKRTNSGPRLRLRRVASGKR